MRAFFVVALLMLIIATPAVAQTAASFSSGKIEFIIKNMGLNINGTMNVTTIQFKRPSADLASWTIEGSAAPATISTGISLRDKHLNKADYFDVAKYPAIQLRSTGIKAKGKNAYEGTFQLTLKGITNTITIPFSITKNGEAENMAGEFTIRRLDYGLGEESSILANNVKIRVSALFK